MAQIHMLMSCMNHEGSTVMAVFTDPEYAANTLRDMGIARAAEPADLSPSANVAEGIAWRNAWTDFRKRYPLYSEHRYTDTFVIETHELIT